MCLVIIYITFLEICLLKTFANFVKELSEIFSFLMLIVVGVSGYFLFQILGLQTLLFSWLIFSLLIALFDAQVFNFEVYLFLKKYCCLCVSVRSNKLLPNLMS